MVKGGSARRALEGVGNAGREGSARAAGIGGCAGERWTRPSSRNSGAVLIPTGGRAERLRIADLTATDARRNRRAVGRNWLKGARWRPDKTLCGVLRRPGVPAAENKRLCLTRPGGMVYCWLGYGWYATPGTSLAVHAAGFRKKSENEGRFSIDSPEVGVIITGLCGRVGPCAL